MTESGQPFFSIITIAFNCESLIGKTMESVFGQSFQDLEYLVVDGASRDGTVALVHRAAQDADFRPLRVVSEPDKGISDAMNKGVLLARGRYVIHLHAGDEFAAPDVLERVHKELSDTGAVVLVGRSRVIDRLGQEGHLFQAELDKRTLLWKNSLPHQAMFIERELFETCGFFDVNLRQAMDYALWLDWFLLHDQNYHCSDVVVSKYLSGGRSSNLGELLRVASLVRRRFRMKYHYPKYYDVIYVGKIYLFVLYSKIMGAFH